MFSGKGISHLVEIPDGVKKIRVSLRMRAPNFEALPLPGSHKAGVHLYLENSIGKLVGAPKTQEMASFCMDLLEMSGAIWRRTDDGLR